MPGGMEVVTTEVAGEGGAAATTEAGVGVAVTVDVVTVDADIMAAGAV